MDASAVQLDSFRELLHTRFISEIFCLMTLLLLLLELCMRTNSFRSNGLFWSITTSHNDPSTPSMGTNASTIILPMPSESSNSLSLPFGMQLLSFGMPMKLPTSNSFSITCTSGSSLEIGITTGVYLHGTWDLDAAKLADLALLRLIRTIFAFEDFLLPNPSRQLLLCVVLRIRIRCFCRRSLVLASTPNKRHTPRLTRRLRYANMNGDEVLAISKNSTPRNDELAMNLTRPWNNTSKPYGKYENRNIITTRTLIRAARDSSRYLNIDDALDKRWRIDVM